VKFCQLYKGFERDFGNPARIRIRTAKELSRLIDDNNGIKPCFLSVSHYKGNKPYLEFIPFDFDGKIERVLKDTNNLEKLLYNNNIPYQIKFSGRKGTHCVIPLEFDSNHPQFVTPQMMSDIQMHCVNKCKLETFDYHLRGNLNALLRIPQTVHEVSNKPSVILRENDGCITVDELCQRLKVKKFTYVFTNNFVSNEKVHPYPCLEYFIKVPNPLNYCRVAFAIYRFKQEKLVSEVLDELSTLEWIDWDRYKTTYHLEKICNRIPSYSMPTCDTLDKYGLCFGCQYDDRRILKKIVRGK